MKLTTYISNINQLKKVKDLGLCEVILSPAELSRFGQVDLLTCLQLAKEAKRESLKVILEWDILLTEKKFTALKDFIRPFNFENIDEFRVQDLGVLNYIHSKHSQKIQFIAETGFHNLKSIKTLENFLGPRLFKDYFIFRTAL